MSLPIELHRKICDYLLLIPQLSNEAIRQNLLKQAGIPLQLQHQIQISLPSESFVRLFVITLHQYGQLDDRRFALEAILEASKLYVQEEQHAYCDMLIQEYRNTVSIKPSHLPDESSRTDQDSQPQETRSSKPQEQPDLDQEPGQRWGIFFRKLQDFFRSLPNMTDIQMQKDLIKRARLDPDLEATIQFGHPPAILVPLLLSLLHHYGPLRDGRNAVEAMLEASKSYLQEEQHAYCDTLIQEYRRLRPLKQTQADEATSSPSAKTNKSQTHPSHNQEPDDVSGKCET